MNISTNERVLSVIALPATLIISTSLSKIQARPRPKLFKEWLKEWLDE